LIKIGVIQLDHNSEWAAPTFVQPKKTGDVQILTDFRKLNEAIVCKPFPLPKISELLQKLQGFTFAMAIDLSMGYYHIPLDDVSQKLCTTILPSWGKYCYLHLPMGIKNSPDIFQSIMHDILGDLEYSSAYIDDILITSSGHFNDHLDKVPTVLK
jgi:Reverse transcriptase (RNA-dependent DNA polymerase)